MVICSECKKEIKEAEYHIECLECGEILHETKRCRMDHTTKHVRYHECIVKNKESIRV